MWGLPCARGLRRYLGCSRNVTDKWLLLGARSRNEIEIQTKITMRPVYTSVPMLETRSEPCHFLPLFRVVRRLPRVERMLCKFNGDNRIGTEPGVLRRWENLVAVLPPKLPRQIAGVVHYILALFPGHLNRDSRRHRRLYVVQGRRSVPWRTARTGMHLRGANSDDEGGVARHFQRMWLEGFVPLILAEKGRASNIQNKLVGGGGKAKEGRTPLVLTSLTSRMLPV
jgi:hypothetical protein